MVALPPKERVSDRAAQILAKDNSIRMCIANRHVVHVPTWKILMWVYVAAHSYAERVTRLSGRNAGNRNGVARGN